MNFLIFRDFSNLDFLIFCAGPTWMRRGTHGHVAAPCGPTRRTFIIVIIYIVKSAFRISEGYSNPLKRCML